GDIHPDKFADIPGQRAGGAGAGFLGDGEQRVAVHRQGATTVDYILDGGEHGCRAGLVVQMAGTYEAVGGEFGQRVEGDEIPHAHPMTLGVRPAAGGNVQPQLDGIPADRQGIDLGIEGVPGGHERQHAAAETAAFGEDADAAAFGKAAGPATDRCQLQPAVVLDLADHGADRIQMAGDGAVRAVLPAQQGRADGAAAGQFVGHAHLIQMFGDVTHYAIGETGGAGNGEHFQQYLLQVLHVGKVFVVHVYSRFPSADLAEREQQ